MSFGDTPSTRPMTGPELWQAGQQQILDGRPDAAMSTFQALLAVHPGHVGARCCWRA
jgi:hypothetical protein